MKKMLFILSTLVFSQFAQAEYQVVYKSELTKINSEYSLGGNPVSGSVVYDTKKGTLTLTFYFDSHSHCRPGSMCPLYIQSPLIVELPVINITEDSCGAKILVAEENKLPVDGALRRITIMENSTNHCQYIRPIAPVEGEYEQSLMDLRKGIITSRATFEGNTFIKTEVIP